MTKISIEKETRKVENSSRPNISKQSVTYKFLNENDEDYYFTLSESEFADLKDQVNKI